MKARIALSLWFFLIGVSLWVLLARTEFPSDLGFFLPKSNDPLNAWIQKAGREGPASRMILGEIEGGTRDAQFRASDALTAALRKDPRIRSARNGISARELEPIEAILLPYHALLVEPLESHPYAQSALHASLVQRITDLTGARGQLTERWLNRDPLGDWTRFIDALREGPAPRTFGGHWVGPDEKTTLMLIESAVPGFDVGPQAELIESIQTQFNALKTEGLTLHLGGPGPLSVATHERISTEAAWLSTADTLMVALLLFLVYRSWRLLALGMVPLLTGVIAAALVTRGVYGGIHAITLGFGGSLLSVAADYPNHFFTHLEGHGPPRKSMARIWPTLRIGILTNMAGFGVMMLAGFQGLEEIGVFAATGLFAAGLTTRYLLPLLAPRKASIGPWIKHFERMPWLGIPLILRWLVCLLIPLVLGMAAVGSGAPIFNDDLASLNPVDPALLHKDLRLQSALEVPDMRQMIIIQGRSAEEVLIRSEGLAPVLQQLTAEGALTGYDLLSNLIPSQKTQLQRKATLPSAESVSIALQKAVAGTPFKAEAFEPWIQDLKSLKDRPALTPETLKYTALEEKIQSVLLVEGSETALLVPLQGIRNPERIEAAIEDLKDSRIHWLDLRLSMTETIHANRLQAGQLLLWGFGGIILILTVGLGSLSRALKVFAPMLLATLTSALIMARLGSGLNVYHLSSLLLVMGLSLDQALFFNRRTDSIEDLKRTHLSIVVCALTAQFAFGGLALSSVPLLAAIGMTVSLGALLALLFAALLAQEAPGPQ
jgi:predicted exporter